MAVLFTTQVYCQKAEEVKAASSNQIIFQNLVQNKKTLSIKSQMIQIFHPVSQSFTQHLTI